MGKNSDNSDKRLFNFGLMIFVVVLAFLGAYQNYYFGPVIVDGFQSAGAYACGEGPLQLHWPFMDGFMGFDTEWGFHWPGWPAFRSCFSSVIPWNPFSEMLLLALIWGVVSFAVAKKVSRWLGHPVFGFASALGMMTGPRYLVGALSYRPEIFGSLLLFIFASSWVGLCRRSYRGYCVVTGSVSSLLLPIVIPEGVAVVAGFLIFWALMLKLREGAFGRVSDLRWISLAYVVGLMGLVGHFLIPDNTWTHLSENLAAQGEIPKGVFHTLRLAVLSKSDLGSWPLWLLGFVAAFKILWDEVRRIGKENVQRLDAINYWALAASLMLLGITGVTFLTGNVNGLRLMMLIPWLVLLSAGVIKNVLESRLIDRRGFRLIFYGAAIGILVAPALFFTYRWSQWNTLNTYALRDRAADCLRSLPDARVTYIPIGLWEAAVEDDRRREFRFATFPNLALEDYRRSYENHVYRDLQEGDLLVFDVIDDEGGGPFPNATKAKMQILSASVRDWSKWELVDEISYKVGDSKAFQRHWKVYRRKP